MEILEAFDLTGGLRAAATLVGCDHKTVAHYVALRDAGVVPDQRAQRLVLIDEFLDKVEEWVDRSRGLIRADVVHDKLTAMGFTGSEPTARRAVAAAKKAWRAGHRRVFRPWVPEPGLWLQFDWGDGPKIAGRGTVLFCAYPTTGAPSLQTLEEVIALTRRLRMPYLRAAALDVVPTARAQRWDPAELLRVLLSEEITGRDHATLRMRRRQANFPAGKTFEVWDEQRCSIPAATQHALRTLEWVDRHENLCVCGPSGTGKSHFREALGQLAIDTGRTVAWFSIEELGALVRRHRADDSINKAIRRITRVGLIIIDDIGMLAVGEDAAEGFYRLVDACYEKRSLAVSSNLHPAGFDEIMPKTLATATVDRLLHHAHICVTDGQSFRLAQGTAGKGVTPLPT